MQDMQGNSKASTISKQWFATRFLKRLWYLMLVVWYTLVDAIISSLRMTGWLEEMQLHIRGPHGVEHMPIAHSSTTFQLEDIK